MTHATIEPSVELKPDVRILYRANCTIPDLGAEKGDLVVVEPSHDWAPIIVVRDFDHSKLPTLIHHHASLALTQIDGLGVISAAATRRWLISQCAGAPALQLVP